MFNSRKLILNHLAKHLRDAAMSEERHRLKREFKGGIRSELMWLLLMLTAVSVVHVVVVDVVVGGLDVNFFFFIFYRHSQRSFEYHVDVSGQDVKKGALSRKSVDGRDKVSRSSSSTSSSSSSNLYL